MNRLSLVSGAAAIALIAAACASTTPKTAAQINADHMLAARVEDALESDPAYFFRHVDVDVDDGKVALSGYVWSDDALRRAVRIASHVPGVTSISDELALERNGGRGAPR
jgi:osmotically-inducible protein OsmY